MKHIIYALLSCIIISLAGCESPSETGKIDDDIYEKNAISNRNKLSAASKRAIERHYEQGPEWFCSFRKQDLKGDFQYEEGVIRRDPTAVILVGDTYYVWYTKGHGKAYGFGTGDPSKKVFPWDLTEIWYATSKDGWDWKERGLAVGRG
ncbi:MAG: glycosyl hydrolase, partial [Phycisphaerae bacterium]|nr:glycosyl hydrolase [Phycisphaerae bacterium]